MKVALLLVSCTCASILSNGLVQAVECGRWFSTDCLGENDIRYDPDASDLLVDQDPIWSLMDGFYTITIEHYGPDGLPRKPLPYDSVTAQSPYPSFPFYGFLNYTVDGSRIYQHRYHVYPPADAEFCSQPLSEGQANVVGNGTCGVNGMSLFFEAFATSTQERDGTATVFFLSEARLYRPAGQSVIDTAYTMSPVDSNTLHSAAARVKFPTTGNESIFTETFLFLDDDFKTAFSVAEHHTTVKAEKPVTYSGGFYRLNYVRVSEDQWLDAIEDAYETYNVLPEDRVQGGELPMKTACVNLACPEEEKHWCKYDPECTQDLLYVEPEATVKSGVIGGFATLGAVLIISGIVIWHYRAMAEQRKRYRKKFADHVTMGFNRLRRRDTVTPNGLNVQNLEKVFVAIDTENEGNGDGVLSKEEIWNFFSSGSPSSSLTQEEFDAMFDAMDTNKDGQVDFLEFCAFVSGCGLEFNELARESLKSKHQDRVSLLEADALVS